MEYMSLFILLICLHNTNVNSMYVNFVMKFFVTFLKSEKTFYPENLVKSLFSYYYFFAKRFHDAKCPFKCYATIKHFIEK